VSTWTHSDGHLVGNQARLFQFALKTALIVGAALAAKPKYIAAVSIPHPTCRVEDFLTLLKAAPTPGKIIVGLTQIGITAQNRQPGDGY
jgi:hypothetical protein